MSRHINQLTIHSLRRMDGLHLPQLGNVNLFVGENNSGKTTVLEGIALFCRPLDPLEWLAVARRRAIKSSRDSLLDSVRWLFPQAAADIDDPYYKGHVRIEGQGSFPCLEASARFQGFGADEAGSSSSGYPDDDEESGSSSYSADDEESSGSSSYSARGADIILSARVPKDRWLLFDASPEIGEVNYEFRLLEDERFIKREPAHQPALPIATVSPFSHRVEQMQVSRLTDATLTGQRFNVLACVNLIDPEVEGLEILSRAGKRPTLWVRHARAGYAPLYSLGDGVRRIVTMALSLIEAQNGVLLIDEIETAIHKSAFVQVFQWLVRAAAHYNVQLFATTHSLEAVDAILMAQMEMPNELVAFHLPEHGKGQAKRFSGELLDDIRFERGIDIR